MKLIVANAERSMQGFRDTAYVILPDSEDEIIKAAKRMDIPNLRKGNLIVVSADPSPLQKVLQYIPTVGVDLLELDLLAYQFGDFSERQGREYVALLTDRKALTLKDLINFAYDSAAGKYEIWYGIYNCEAAGRKFAKQTVPALASKNLDKLYLTKVGDELLVAGGKMTGVGFIKNFSECFRPKYNGDNLRNLLSAYTPAKMEARVKEPDLRRREWRIKSEKF
jgi:hypothetical protein